MLYFCFGKRSLASAIDDRADFPLQVCDLLEECNIKYGQNIHNVISKDILPLLNILHKPET